MAENETPIDPRLTCRFGCKSRPTPGWRVCQCKGTILCRLHAKSRCVNCERPTEQPPPPTRRSGAGRRMGTQNWSGRSERQQVAHDIQKNIDEFLSLEIQFRN